MVQNCPIGEGTIGKFMKTISNAAETSKVYINYKIKGITATFGKGRGYTLDEIAFVLKHKNLESLKYYTDRPTLRASNSFQTPCSNSVKNRNKTKKNKK